MTELCFGALPMGLAQKNMPPEESAEVVAEALRLGVNFIDTAQGYLPWRDN
ncbi:MAG: aldo/keto reductase [Oscillospiraceae bacterium]|nr:aldo/keto reductase [Oscillospiraceae bacterium]